MSTRRRKRNSKCELCEQAQTPPLYLQCGFIFIFYLFDFLLNSNRESSTNQLGRITSTTKDRCRSTLVDNTIDPNASVGTNQSGPITSHIDRPDWSVAQPIDQAQRPSSTSSRLVLIVDSTTPASDTDQYSNQPKKGITRCPHCPRFGLTPVCPHGTRALDICHYNERFCKIVRSIFNQCCYNMTLMVHLNLTKVI